jgi:hypothetical protein|tara:strand:- start:756 stop:1172 length:417 start_codon:yes stop_codon:yes gene_type:complete
MTTDQIIGELNKTGRFGLSPLQSTETTNQFEHYDADNHQFMVEIKSRDYRYADWLIEKYKYEENMELARISSRMFVYVTEFDGNIYVWNMYDLAWLGYEITWENGKSMPNTTEFADRGRRYKSVAYLPENICWFTLSV